MGILGGIMGRREPVLEYRTVDGGHPAPYPDMTDEQLYNYEVTFNVPRRTFSRPPRPAARQAQSAPPPVQEDFTPARDFMHTPELRQPGRAQQAARPDANAAQPDGERLRRNKAFDAPRYTARKAAPASERVPHSSPALDFSKPVRLVTTKQPVDIITTRARHPLYKVHGYIGDDDVVTVFTLDGQLSENGPRFLENAPLLRQLHLNIYPAAGKPGSERYRITQHDTRVDADAAAEPGRITCVAVQFGTPD